MIEVSLGEKVNGKAYDVHLESLKRLPSLVSFLAEKGQLTVAHVQRLWKVSQESGDTPKRAVFDILNTAAKHLAEEHFDVIFDSLASVNLADVDVPLLTLVTTLTKFALVASAQSVRMLFAVPLS